MPRLSFSLRDMFWLTLVIALGVGWWVESQKVALWSRRGAVIEIIAKQHGWMIDWDSVDWQEGSSSGLPLPVLIPLSNETGKESGEPLPGPAG